MTTASKLPASKYSSGSPAELARETWVVAPEHDQSGVSHAVSLHHPIRATERGPRRWAVTGTPGDCVVMALSHLMRGAPPQLLLSGVNRGANLGIETVFSGTVGGAMTGMMLGIPSIALSQAWTDRANLRWETSASAGSRISCAACSRSGGAPALASASIFPIFRPRKRGR